MATKNFDMLRAFDLDAAKRGAKICFRHTANPAEFIAGPDADGEVCVKNTTDNTLLVREQSFFRMSPIAWVRKSNTDDSLCPVYKGDTLYYGEGAFHPGSKFVVGGDMHSDLMINGVAYFDSGEMRGAEYINKLVYDAPKQPAERKTDGYIIASKSQLMTREQAEEAMARIKHNGEIVVARAEW